jgi:hypothetical protein
MVLNKVYDANQKRKMATIAGKGVSKNFKCLLFKNNKPD